MRTPTESELDYARRWCEKHKVEFYPDSHKVYRWRMRTKNIPNDVCTAEMRGCSSPDGFIAMVAVRLADLRAAVAIPDAEAAR